MPLTLADILARAISGMVAHFTRGRIEIHINTEAPPPPPRPAGPLPDIGPDPTTREYVWRALQHFNPGRFPGGRTQFEAACNAGWVRVKVEAWGFHLDIGPPPAGQAPPRSEAPPPRPAGRDAIAGAMKRLGYRKADQPAPAEIREQYRDLVKRHHPDRFATRPAKAALATERMKRINEAYQLLRAHGLAE